jgi:hypothetical protein
MSDEQLHTLFAAMERHLDKRADGLEHGVAAAEQRLEARFDQAVVGINVFATIRTALPERGGGRQAVLLMRR